MGWWDYSNIGASAKPENKKHVQKIFEYIGFAAEPGYAPDGEECSFLEPDVYGCRESANDYESGHVKKEFNGLSEKDLLYLLNALFPKTKVYVHHAEGNNTSDTWENHDRVYNPENMTLECNDSYTDYGGDGPNGSRSWKERFALEAPKAEYIDALINFSTADNNTELTKILQELLQKLKDGLITYENDTQDTRIIGEKYDIEEDGSLDEMEEEDLDELIDEGRYVIQSYQFLFDRKELEELKASVIAWAEKEDYDLGLEQKDEFEEFFSKLGFDQYFDTEPDDEDDDLISAGGDFVDVMNDLPYPFMDLLNVLLPYLQNNEDTVEICLLAADEYADEVRVVNKVDGELDLS